jgi:hypothetical protein
MHVVRIWITTPGGGGGSGKLGAILKDEHPRKSASWYFSALKIRKEIKGV